MQSTQVPLRGSLAAVLLIVTAACQDAPTEPQQPVEPAAALSATAAATASNTWLTRADMPGHPRTNVVTASVSNAQNQSVLYVFGGRHIGGQQVFTVQAYNTATNTWSYKKSASYIFEYTHGAQAIGGKIYIAGGLAGRYETLPYLLQYDPAKDTWIRKRDVPVEGFAGVSGVINGKLYVLTRCQNSYGYCSNPDYDISSGESRFFGAYDPATDQWTPLALPPGGRDHQHGAAGVIGGKLYVAGGRHTSALDIYDPATNQWTSGASMGSIRGYTAGAAVAGKLYVIAGARFVYNSDGTLASSDGVTTTSRYDPATNAWTNLKTSPRGGGGLGADRVVVGGQPRIELVGGELPGNNLQYIP
jgi:N-acetylneuraminic acid mutarotase